MRTRTSNSQLIYPTGSVLGCTGSSCNSDQASCFADQTKSMSDDVRPGYFVAKKLGKVLPTGPMSQDGWTREFFGVDIVATADYWSSGTWRPAYYRAELTQAVPCFRPLSALTEPATPTLNESLLVQKALANAQTNAWDVLTFVAEFHKTVDLLSTAQRRWWSHFERVFKATKSRLRDLRNVGDVFTEVWLEYRFGLRPILYDIQAINETLRRLEEGIPALSRGWATDTAETMKHGSSTVGTLEAFTIQGTLPKQLGAPGFGGASTTHSWVWTRTVTGRASVGVTVETRGLTQVDIPVTLWELTPWSVFVEYFLNVGDILSAFSPTATGNLAYATYSLETVDVITQTSEWVFVDIPDFVRWTTTGGTGAVVQRRVQKTRKVVVPTPSLQLSFDLDVSQVLDLIAVAWGYKRRAHSLLKSLASRR